jgi:hypothetical protein
LVGDPTAARVVQKLRLVFGSWCAAAAMRGRALVDKILKEYKHGEAFMDSSSNEMRLGQMAQKKLIAFFKV